MHVSRKRRAQVSKRVSPVHEIQGLVADLGIAASTVQTQEESRGSWQQLDEGVQRKILHELGLFKEIKEKRLTCRQWASVLQEKIQKLAFCELDELIVQRVIRSMHHFTHIEELYCQNGALISGAEFGNGWGRHLKKLTVPNCYDLTDRGLSQVRHLSGLVQLLLREGRQLESGQCQRLTALTRLTSLELYNWQSIDGAILNVAQTMTRLVRVGLNSVVNFRDFSPFTGLSNLQRLCVISSEPMSNVQVVHLTALRCLTGLMLAPCSEMTDHAMRDLCLLTRMRRLSLLASDISHIGVRQLGALQQLAKLDLSFSLQWSEEMCAALTHFGALVELKLANCSSERTGPLAMHSLGQLRGLQQLELGTNLIHQLDALCPLSQLTLLAIDECFQLADQHLANEHLMPLSTLINLAELNLSGLMGIGRLGLAHLKSLTALRRLDLSFCHQITDEECRELSTYHQGLEIVF